MGASNVTDSDLLALKIEIIKDENPEVRKLIISKKSIEQYKKLIRQKLTNGFWNDLVGKDQIYFIFKLKNGKIIEYVYSENNREKIAELCTKLNKDPIEKTNKLLDYLAENPFYKDAVEIYRNNSKPLIV